MKKFLVITVFILLIADIYSYSQEKVKLESLSLSSGEGALSSGVFFEGNFSRGNDIINVSLGNEDMYVLYLKALGKKFWIGPSVEYYHKVPTLGIMANFVPIKTKDFSVSTLTWTGISAGKPDSKVELLNWQFLFFWQSIDVSYKRFTATGALINFDNVWGSLVDFKYKQPLNKNWQIFTSAGYSFYGDGKALLKIGVTYTPN